MKIYVDNELLFEISETKKNVIKNDILEEELDEDLKRRLGHAINDKYENCLRRLKSEWIPKLQSGGITHIPLDDEAFAELVFRQPSYKNRSQRDLEAKQNRILNKD